MLADDFLGAKREDTSQPPKPEYLKAFEAIQSDPNNQLIVVEDQGQVIGMMQLTFIPFLTYIGSWQCLVEGVRVMKAHRNQGVGTELLKWAINYAMEKGCLWVRLTSDKQRPDAIKFYEKLGFTASHVGFKLNLKNH